MPWCATCDRFLSPPTVRSDGTCPTCGGGVDGGHAHTSTTTTGESNEARRASLPWHLWLFAAAVAVYLGFRAWQGIEWVIQQL